MLTEGDLVAGRYALNRLRLDEGQAQWWSATDEDLSRDVLVKILTTATLGEAFAVEGRDASHLRHDGAVRVHDVLTANDPSARNLTAPHPRAPDPTVQANAIIMEQPSGSTLGADRAPGQAISWSAAEPVLRSIVEVMEAAHVAGIHHGGLRPELVWVRDQDESIREPSVTVAGFGTRLQPATDRHLAPELRAPEPRAPEPRAPEPRDLDDTESETGLLTPDVASDVHAIASLAYLLLSGHRPDGTRLHHRSAIAWPLADAIMSGLNDDPAARPDSPAALLTAMQEGATTPTGRRASTAAQPSLQSPGRWRLLLPVLLILALGAVALWFFGFNDSSDTASSEGTPVPSATTAPTPAPTVILEPTSIPTLAPAPTPVATATPTPVAPTILSALAFDPPPGSGGEQDGLTINVFDGVAGTEWSTEVYGSFNFGGLKTGVGIVVLLETATVLDRLSIQSPTQQWQAQIHVADEAVTTLEEWGSPVAQIEMTPDLDGQVNTAFAPIEGAAVLIWITELGQYGGGFGTAIDEITFNTDPPPPGTDTDPAINTDPAIDTDAASSG